MLVLSRRLNQRIVFPDIRTAIEVLAVRPGFVRLGIAAPPEVSVHRQEVHDRMAQWQPATSPAAPPADAESVGRVRLLVRNRLRVARTGLAELRRQLRAGQTEDALIVAEKLEEDLQMLTHRLQDGPRPPAPAKKPAARHHALLVEDNRNERELLAGFLRLAGLQVDTAGDGSDALDWLQQRGRPDVVLLDMGLPRCDGATMVRTLRRNPAYADLKIFAVTGHSPDEFDLEQGPGGIDRWFRKPVNAAALVRDLTADLATTERS